MNLILRQFFYQKRHSWLDFSPVIQSGDQPGHESSGEVCPRLYALAESPLFGICACVEIVPNLHAS